MGQNSSGKSSILRALNSFFNFESEKTYCELSRHSYSNTSTAIIEIEFDDTTADVDIPRGSPNSSNVKIRLKYKRTAVWNVFSNGQLKLDFATVVDKDYFLPYLNDELDASRDNGGFPKYRKHYQASALIESMVPDAAARKSLFGLMVSNHSKAMNILEKFNGSTTSIKV